MTAASLLRLYPRAWRERYGDELLDLVGDQPLGVAQVIDIVSGALDARLSSELQMLAATARRPVATTQGGSAVVKTLKRTCAHNSNWPFTLRDSWIGAGIVIGGSIGMSAIGILVSRQGMPTTGEFLKSLAFPASILFTLPVTWLKGQSWRVQVAVIGGTLVPLVLITALAFKL
jgi:hypothetical protein